MRRGGKCKKGWEKFNLVRRDGGRGAPPRSLRGPARRPQSTLAGARRPDCCRTTPPAGCAGTGEEDQGVGQIVAAGEAPAEGDGGGAGHDHHAVLQSQFGGRADVLRNGREQSQQRQRHHDPRRQAARDQDDDSQERSQQCGCGDRAGESRDRRSRRGDQVRRTEEENSLGVKVCVEQTVQTVDPKRQANRGERGADCIDTGPASGRRPTTPI